MSVVLACVLAAVGNIGLAVAQDEAYDGEGFCRDTPAWPGGTYLGQMHPYHSDFYRGYAERREWDPCVTWAQDQRASAIRGLRAVGLHVSEPIDADLEEARALLRHALQRLDELYRDEPPYYVSLTDGVYGSRVHIEWATLEAPTRATYGGGDHVIRVSNAYRGERPQAIAYWLAHEFVHASRPHRGMRTLDACFDEERFANEMSAWVWWVLEVPTPHTSAEQTFRTPDEVMTDTFNAWIRDTYADICAAHVAG